MRTMTKLAGVRINNPLAKKISISQDDIDIANTPGIKLWIEAGHKFFEHESKIIRERVEGQRLYPSDMSKTPVLDAFSNGAPAFRYGAAGVAKYSVPVSANSESWSVVVACRQGSESPPGEIFSSATPGAANSFPLRVGFNTSGEFKVWDSETRTRIASGSSYLDQDVVLMATFSVSNGLNLFCNGSKVATNANDKTPLDDTSFVLGAMTNDMFDGLLGHALLFDVDLSDDIYQGQMENLNRILKTRYGIS